MSITPPATGTNGLVFGAWFTYDPADAGNDDAHHHWFTLQGDLSSAKDGKVILPIFQTLGTGIDGNPVRNINAIGHATLTMTGCGRATLEYQFDSELAHTFNGLHGVLNLTQFSGCTSP